MRFIKSFLFYLLCFIYLEYVYKVQVFHITFDSGLLVTFIFTILYALLFTIFTSLIPKKISFPVILGLLGIITFIYLGEAFFTIILHTTFSVYSLNMTNQALDFASSVFEVLNNNKLTVFLFLIPLITYIMFHKKIDNHCSFNECIRHLPKVLIVYFLIFKMLGFNVNDTYSIYNLYFNTHAPDITVTKLGLFTEFRLDITRYLFGFKPKVIVDSVFKEKEELVEYNELDLDFSEFTDDTSNYLKNRPSTNKNEYTGIFKDKNIIYILAEGFNTIAVNEELTPTLYKLVNSSFVFTNYYSPMFMSTTGGEFQYSLSLIPTQQSLNVWKTGKNVFPYAIGNAFNSMKYKTYAYHDWNYFYYQRQKTMPTLGFDNFLACGNGLEKRINCNVWPPSDVEMITATIPDYISEEKFAVYYVTVSGHAEYNFDGNYIASKNEELVSDLEYSNSVKAYLATQIELDRALEVLIKELKKNKKLDDTVIVLSGDHYPYFLSTSEINEISDFKRDEIFGVNSSNLIIYNEGIKKTEIDTLASSVDVLPTILNMYGYEYDARLLIGSDIMSKHTPLVIFSDYSWISDKGKYNVKTNKFIPNNGEKIDENYIASINREVQNRVNSSDYIILNNYYEKILAK